VEARKELLKLDSITLSAQVAEARTKSGKISRIYDEYLRGWFHRVFGQPEEDVLWSAINFVWGQDQQIVFYLQGLVTWLSKEAQVTLDMADQGDFQSANGRILSTRRAIAPFRQRLKQTMTGLHDLQGIFDDAAGVPGL
jgi:hypothetical protein